MEPNKESNFVSAVVYCHDDSDCVEPFINGLYKKLSATFVRFEIIIVNDSSSDNSIQLIKSYAENHNDKIFTILNMSYHQGLEISMNAGVQLSIGDFVFEFDSMNVDYDWNVVTDVYFRSLKGFDIVSAKVNRKPRILARLFYRIFNRYAKLQHQIGAETFRVLSRRAINSIHSHTHTVPFRRAAYANCGLPIDVIQYNPISRNRRKRYDDRLNLAIDSIIIFTDIAYRATLVLVALMMFITLSVAAYALVYKLTNNPVEGWTATILFIAFGSFGLFSILAMVIKYLQTLLKLNFNKKQFVFESIEKL